MALTMAEAIATFGVEIDPHLDREVTIPVIAGLQFQGDVAVVPVSIAKGNYSSRLNSAKDVPAAGFPVVRGEVGGNTHLLIGDGKVRFAPVEETSSMTTNLDLGVLDVPEGSTAYLAHPEHAYTGIAPGQYVIRRQREQADEIRLVAD